MSYHIRYNEKENRVKVEWVGFGSSDRCVLSEEFDCYDAAELRMYRMREAFRKESAHV